MNGNEIEQACAALLQSDGIRVDVRYCGEQTRENNWKCDAWRFELSGANRAPVQFDYFTGLGHRKAPAGKRNPFPPRTIGAEAWDREWVKPRAPAVAGLLASVYLDDPRGETFADWCANFGLDTDSRKALETYEACQNIHSKALRFFGRELWNKIAALVEVY